MRNFLPATYLDTLDALAELHSRDPASWPARDVIGTSLLLRGPREFTPDTWLEDLPIEDLEALTEAPALTRLLAEAQRAIMADWKCRALLTGRIGRAMIWRLDGRTTIPWHIAEGPYHERTVRFHLPLVTNPRVLCYVQDETLHLTQGVLCHVVKGAPQSAGNFGNSMALHLVFDMERGVTGHA